MDHSYSSFVNKSPVTNSSMKPLTERQQMALLLQMTSEENATPTRKGKSNFESPCSGQRSVNRRNDRGETQLHVAAIRGDVNKIKSLISEGADVNTEDYAGWTPLHEAANRGLVSVARELLKNGAKVNVTGLDGVTPLHDASVNGHTSMITLLLRYGANPSLKTASQKTALDLAGSPQVIQILAQSNQQKEGMTDENSPEGGSYCPTTESSWKVQKQSSKSRRNLRLDCFSASQTHVISRDEMEPSVNVTTEESKDAKPSTESEVVTAGSSVNCEEAVKEEIKEAETTSEIPASQKRTLEGEEEDEDTKKKRRKDDVKETKPRAGSNIRSKDRKSPNTIQADGVPNDSDDDKKEPKVPPLKIVLSNSNEVDTNIRSKSGNGRGSLAYVVSTSDEKSESSNGGSEKSDDKVKDSIDIEKSGSTSSNGGRVTRSSQRAAATAAHSTPTSGQNSANQSPTSSPTQNPTNQAPSPDPGEMTNNEQQPAATVVKADETKPEESPVEVHPRKRKLRPREPEPPVETVVAATANAVQPPPENVTPPLPLTNCYEMYFSIRKQIERRHRNLLPVQPKPPQGFKDYLMNRCTYVIAGNAASRLSVPVVSPPPSLPPPMRDLFAEQEKERYRLRMQHLIEKEKLVLSVEQEILRVHGRAARALANQSLPFSVCTLLKDQEVYSALTPEQEEKDRNARSRYNGRLFLSWLQDVDDKWEKIKESMLLRHHNEAESLHAVQRMDWEWKIKELGLCEPQNKPVVDELHVPMVNVSDDFDFNYNSN
ncbi:ankyrin repeat domain-containing protein 11 [Daphnia magna]|uniref:Myotrophin n=1 Tax=Daphnia magna TaxID=35525 RepID=A0A162Q7W5_9CRUS|nr:ankyrin repeat domain-containing protein 11 [Daphnia magna]KZS19438.1 Myotrophin [Daphnia magna]